MKYDILKLNRDIQRDQDIIANNKKTEEKNNRGVKKYKNHLY